MAVKAKESLFHTNYHHWLVEQAEHTENPWIQEAWYRFKQMCELELRDKIDELRGK